MVPSGVPLFNGKPPAFKLLLGPDVSPDTEALLRSWQLEPATLTRLQTGV